MRERKSRSAGEQEKESEFKEKVVQIRRVTKVVKGGKKMGFRAAVVVGDQVSRVGLGVGKSIEISAAIRKGVEVAKRELVEICQVSGTLPHRIDGRFGASHVILRPAPQGTGVIAGGAVRSVLELCGMKNVVAKSIGSSNAINVARATLAALTSLKSLEKEQELRGKEIQVDYVTAE
ncbi:MAG: 30S ribosomal protein S5 [Candidatus Margulisiibacteriota bacterium]